MNELKTLQIIRPFPFFCSSFEGISVATCWLIVNLKMSSREFDVRWQDGLL